MSQQRVLLIFPKMFTMVRAFEQGFLQNNCIVDSYDNSSYISNSQRKIYHNLHKLPSRVRARWQQRFLNLINKFQLEKFREFQPDIVVIYNGGMVMPETAALMKKEAKVCFYMGDSPFYPAREDSYLSCLMQADLILCPDSYWGKQLTGIGIDSIRSFLIACSTETNHVKEVSAQERERWRSDLVFVGRTSPSSRGFKGSLFLDQFTRYDFKIYTGKGITRWYEDFPGLKQRTVHPAKRLTDNELNTILNCCKLYPVDANPGLINGVHLRIFECIGSGILPLVEYRKDVKDIFGKQGLPIITNYKAAGEMAAYYLHHDQERMDILQGLRSFVAEKFSPAQSIANVLDHLQ